MLLISVNMIHSSPYINEVHSYIPSDINADTMNCFAFNTILYEDITCIIEACVRAHTQTHAHALAYVHKHTHK